MKKYTYLYLFVTSFSLFAMFQLAKAEEVTPLATFLDKLETFQADFKQTLINENGEELETVTGIVYMKSPGKFRWDYQDPYSQMIITDGSTLWLYDEDLEQVTIKDITGSIENTPAAILSGEENINEHFVVIDMGVIEGFNWIELTPKDIENQYSSIRLGFDHDKLGMMVLFDNLGQTTRIDFLNSKRNGKLKPTLFTFEPPINVDVLDDRG
jgi:outer membrane lipoprotein carrier protein